MALSFGKTFRKARKNFSMIFEKEGKSLTLQEFEKQTGAHWIPALDFDNFHTFQKITKKTLTLHKKGELTLEQLWLGRYFQKELFSNYIPEEIAIRWIDENLGWGVFALRDFKKNEFIAEYVGKVRKREKADIKNAYCFEHLITHSVHSSYTIDALEQGGPSRYMNHSQNPNCNSSLATLDNLSHVIISTNRAIAKGEQLCYDYEPDYWSKRKAPILI